MIIRQLKERQYLAFCNFLRAQAQPDPLGASYTVFMTIDGGEYTLKLQPERHNKIAILQALSRNKQESTARYELITGGILLASLLEILIHQKVSQ